MQRLFCRVRPVERKAAGGSLAIRVQDYDLSFVLRLRWNLDPSCPVLVATRAPYRELPYTPSLIRPNGPPKTGEPLATRAKRSAAKIPIELAVGDSNR